MTTLRRFGTRLREHDWLTVLVELAIVMAGVFLGIEAANWNQSRQDRAEERRYYGQIIEDLRNDLTTLATAEKLSRSHDRAAENTLTALRDGIPTGTSPARVARDIHLGGWLFIPKPARGTYDELISTGNLGLLRDDRAKAAIAEYYRSFDSNRQWDEIMRQQQSDYWRRTAGVLPRNVLQAALEGTVANVTTEQAATMIAEAKQRPELADLLVGMAAYQARVRRDSKRQATMARELIGRLEPLAG